MTTLRGDALNLNRAAESLDELWSPRLAATVNDVVVKVVRIAGDFVRHDHPDTDEAFLCLSGSLSIDLWDDGPDPRRVELQPGDLFVVPRGIEHCPHSANGASVALFEAAGTVNTGAAGGELTAAVDRPL